MYLNLVNPVLRVSSHRGDFRSTLQIALDEALRVTGSECGLVGRVEEGTLSSFEFKNVGPDFDQTGILTHLLNVAIRGEKESKIINEVGNTNLKRLLIVPATENGKVVLVTVLANKSSDYTESDVKFMEAFMACVYHIIEKRRLEETLRTIIENTGTSVVVLDEKGRILYMNTNAEKLFGVEKKKMVGNMFTEFIPGKYRDTAIEKFRMSVLSTGTPTNSFEMKIVDRRGNTKYVIAIPNLIASAKQVIVSLVDITSMKKKDRELESLVQRLGIIHKIDHDILKGKDFEDIAETIIRSVREVVGSEIASLLLYDSKHNLLKLQITNAESEILVESCNKPATDFLRSFELLKKGEIVKVDDVSSVKSPTEHEQQLLRLGFKSYVLVPLIARNELIGIFCLGSKKPEKFSDKIDFVREVTSQLAVALQEARLYDMKVKAFEQIDHNIEQFAILVDHIRNPLAAAQGFVEVYVENEEVQSKIKEQIDRIIELIKKLEKGWIESEHIREFLRRERGSEK